MDLGLRGAGRPRTPAISGRRRTGSSSRTGRGASCRESGWSWSERRGVQRRSNGASSTHGLALSTSAGLEPAAARLVDAVAHEAPGPSRLCASVEIATLTPMLLRQPAVHVVEVEPLRVGVELEEAAALARRRDHALQVHLVGRRARRSAARWGARGCERAGCPWRAGCARSARSRERSNAVVHRAHDAGRARPSDVVGQIERAVLEDVDLDRLEHAEAVELAR